MRDELVNNLAKLANVNDHIPEVEKHLAWEHKNLTENNDSEIQQETRDQIRNLERELSDII